MAKRIASAILAMVFLLVMVPTVALAAEGDTVYVGGEALTSTNGAIVYATTDDSGNVSTNDATAENYNIKWDGSTLILSDAYITKYVNEDNSAINGTAIGVANSSGNAELTIQLEGSNTVSASTGIHVYSSNGTASLTIMGNGSLTASSSSKGIWVQSNSNKATLAINNAKVTATSEFGIGVSVQAGNSSDASLTVEGGSLTASGASGRKGILFPEGNPSLNVSDSAIVRASGGIASGTNENDPVTPSGVGIVFNDSQGTVYGSVELKDNLTIGEGESLTPGDGASLNAGGHNVIVDGGTLDDSIKNSLGDSVKYPPTITTASLPNGEVDTIYKQTLEATGSDTITWSVSGSLPAGLSLSGSSISGTPTAADTSTFTVTAENSYGSNSKEFSITISAPASVSVTGVSLNKDRLNLYVGGNETLTATVQPTNATNKGVTWSSDNESVVTVNNGVVTAVSAGTATITVTTSDGDKTATCLVTVTGVYIPPRPTGPDWGDVADDIADAVPGSTVTVDMDGKTMLPGEVLNELAGRDVTLTLDMGGGVSWEIYGGDVPADAEYDDVDLGVALGGDAIPADVVNLVTGESGSVQVSLGHDGPFGFSLTLVAPLGEDAAGLVANLYRYDGGAGSLVFEASARVDGGGAARLPLDHASEWLVALDSRSHELPFPDALEGEWYSEAVRWAWLSGLMAGYGDGSGVFGTEGALSRAQLATVLWRQAGEPEAEGGPSFADCDPGAFYAEAVAWADEQGIVEGYGDGANFGPEDPVTREQLATILWRAAGEPGGSGDLSGYPDGDEASSYAVPALEWAVGEGVLSGLGGGSLAPGGVLSRAQLAAVLMRMA